MAGILDFDINSSDNEEDDCNYEPEMEEASEDSGEESEESYGEGNEGTKDKKAKGKNKSVVEDETDDKDSKEPELDAFEKKKREENLWESFKLDVHASDLEKKSTKDDNIEKLFTDIGSNKLILLASVASNAYKSVNLDPEGDKIGSNDGKKLTSEVDFNANVQEQQSPSDEPADKPKSQPIPGIRKRSGGLGSLIGSINNKKPKMSTLEKSALDWNMFKKEEGIEEDLERFNKGKGGYLEKQAFLERSDLRQYRLERDIRLSNKRKL